MQGIVNGLSKACIGSKKDVREFWDLKSCGEVYAIGTDAASAFATLPRTHYALSSKCIRA